MKKKQHIEYSSLFSIENLVTQINTDQGLINAVDNVNLNIGEKEIFGLFNMVSDGSSTRYDVADEILKILNKKNMIQLHAVNSTFFKKTYFVNRPESEILINKKLNLKNLNIMRDWRICLKEYIQSNFNI